MAVIHQTTMSPTKLELLARWLPEQPWYRGPADRLVRAGGFRLDDPAAEVGSELMVLGRGDGAAYERGPVLRAQLLALLNGTVVAQAQNQRPA